MNEQQLRKIAAADGFVAALDQSGGSTPRALASYGVTEDAYHGDEAMLAMIHEMRTRIVTSPSFDGDRILGAILFEATMDREIEGLGSAQYLWDAKKVVPFLKVDEGLEDEVNGVQTMKPIPDLESLLGRAKDAGIFGTKMRSVIQTAGQAGVAAIVDQQFQIAERILNEGLIPIIEPEIDIHSPTKRECEALLVEAVQNHVDHLDPAHHIMLKLTLPEQDDLYLPLIEHPRVLRVVALSGGLTRDLANERLSRNHGMIASFSRALIEGLTVQQSNGEFDGALDASIESIFKASKT